MRSVFVYTFSELAYVLSMWLWDRRRQVGRSSGHAVAFDDFKLASGSFWIGSASAVILALRKHSPAKNFNSPPHHVHDEEENTTSPGNLHVLTRLRPFKGFYWLHAQCTQIFLSITGPHPSTWNAIRPAFRLNIYIPALSTGFSEVSNQFDLFRH